MLIAAVAAIIIISLVIIGSATHINTPSEERYWFVQRQGIFAIINAGIVVFLMNFDYSDYASSSYVCRTIGTGGTAMDSAWSYYLAAVGVFQADNDCFSGSLDGG